MSFKIGRNPISALRDYDYVVLRHIPIAENTFAEWGVGTLPGYSSEPTWKYSSPHNIARWTDRTDTTGGRSCWDACHGTANDTTGYFLRQSDLDILSPNEAAANEELIVPDGPPNDWP